MNIGKIQLDNDWRLMNEVNTGEEFLIQNLSQRVEFIVTDTAPTSNDTGGLLSSCQQLMFKRVDGDLYMRSTGNYGNQFVNVEKVEG